MYTPIRKGEGDICYIAFLEYRSATTPRDATADLPRSLDAVESQELHYDIMYRPKLSKSG